MPRTRALPNRWMPAARAGAFALVSSAVWVGLVATSIVFYEPLAQHGKYYLHGELIGFSTAFAVAGSLAMIAATAVYGSWRRAVVTAVLVVLLSPLPALEVWRASSPAVKVLMLRWDDLLSSIEAGAVLGAPAGLIAGAFVAVLATATRRRLSWKIGLLAAVAICAAMVWIIPPIVAWSWLLAIRARDALRLDLGATYGGIVGAVIGAICGAVVGAMMARWPGTLGSGTLKTGEGSPQ